MERRRATLNDVILDLVESERIDEDNTITNHPVESGADISDHARNEPSILRISGTMVEDAANKLQVLRNYRKERTVLHYTGRNIYGNLVIERFGRDHGKENRYGYSFDMVLQQVRITTPEEVRPQVRQPNKPGPDKKTNTKVNKTVNRGMQQPKKTKVNKQVVNKMKKDVKK